MKWRPKLHTFLVHAQLLSVLARTDIKGSPAAVRFNPVSSLAQLRLTTARFKEAVLVHPNRIIYRMDALVIVVGKVDPGNAPPQVVTETCDEPGPIHDKGAAPTRNTEKPCPSLLFPTPAEKHLAVLKGCVVLVVEPAPITSHRDAEGAAHGLTKGLK